MFDYLFFFGLNFTLLWTNNIESLNSKKQFIGVVPISVGNAAVTIKLNACTLSYKADDGETYIFILTDTPGHVNFIYEVSRSLAACEGAILVVDSTQGVETQTFAKVYLAVDNDLDILPVINKIDLPSASPEIVKKEIEDQIGIDNTKFRPPSEKELKELKKQKIKEGKDEIIYKKKKKYFSERNTIFIKYIKNNY